MINSAKEARKVLETVPTEFGRLHGQLETHAFARGYIAALEGPEVMALVEVAKELAVRCRMNDQERPHNKLCIACKALSLYREAIGEKP